MNKIMLDGSFLEALMFKNHERHEETGIIMKVIRKDDYLYIPSHILVAMMNKLESHGDAGRIFYENILNNTRIGCNIGRKEHLNAHEMFKSTDLSYQDCLTITLMKKMNIRNIISFNEGFDKIRGIRRLYRVDKLHPHQLNYFN